MKLFWIDSLIIKDYGQQVLVWYIKKFEGVLQQSHKLSKLAEKVTF